MKNDSSPSNSPQYLLNLSAGEVESIYGDIRGVMTSDGSILRRYGVARDIFGRLADLATRKNGIVFTGLLSRVDHILHILDDARCDRELKYRIHQLRFCLSNTERFDQPTLEKRISEECSTLCRWVELLTGYPVPVDLRIGYNRNSEKRGGLAKSNRYLRIIVDRLEGEMVYGRIDDGDMTAVRVALRGNSMQEESDFRYLASCLTEGSQINLVDFTGETKGILYPGIIIYEPDYLIDISGIAECFEIYADSPAVGLLKRLEPEKTSFAMLLGSFAGELLDETLHKGADQVFDYRESVKKFFRHNALKIAVCEDLSNNFHNCAATQQLNIERALSKDLPEGVPDYDAESTVLEPSFFSEILGLQGRMDMLQTDFSVLVEQKSGKGEWGSDEHGSPRVKESHFVQLLLYQALLRYSSGMKKSAPKSFLLYSKYPRPLVSPGIAPRLLSKALGIRNMLVRQEIDLAMGNGFRRLLDLTPDSMNEKKVSEKLWRGFIKPRLQECLSPLHTSDKLTLRYVARLMQFVAMEQLCSKTGFNGETMTTGFSGIWKTQLADKKANGEICDNLVINAVPIASRKSVDGVSLIFNNPENVSSLNFRRGDIVVLYPYKKGEIPDIRRVIAHRGTIEELNSDGIRVRLRASQSNPRIFLGDNLWAVEHDYLDSSYRSNLRGVFSFLSAPADRRSLILGSRRPMVEMIAAKLHRDYGAFNEMVRHAMQSRDIYAVIGPPGTGKTSHGLMNILREELCNDDSAVILTAYTNRAVDEICSKLVEDGISFMRLGSETGCDPAYHSYLQGTIIGECGSVSEVRNVIRAIKVVVGTVRSLSVSGSYLFRLKRFSLAIIDEASQILEHEILPLFSSVTSGRPSVGRFVMIGDHKQLPAVVRQNIEQSAVRDPELNKIGMIDCRNSFFERFLSMVRRGSDGTYPKEYVYELSCQGRMHRDISIVASELFYGGSLGIIPLPHQIESLRRVESDRFTGNLLNNHRVVFCQTNSPDNGLSRNVNRADAEAVAAFLKEILDREGEKFNSETTVGVIVPYRNQIAEIRRVISEHGISGLDGILIDTVERFQGSQRDYIIYDFTVSHLRQLSFLTSTRFVDNGHLIDRKLNVALTRSRSHLILIGDEKLLCRDPLFNRLLSMDCVRRVEADRLENL